MFHPTADLCDKHADALQIAEPIFADFGGRLEFAGPIATVRCFEDNTEVRSSLESPGEGRVLVVDGGGSVRCALMGDNLAQLAIDNDWVGVLIFGCIRDSDQISQMPVAVKALATHPQKSRKQGWGERGVPVSFAGVRFEPGHWLYADADGIIVSAAQLSL